MATSFEGKTIIITGASEGIGRALALALAGQRARLALAARSADRLDELAEDCQALGAETLMVLWGPAGGYVSAVALRAAGAESRFERPASYACQYLSFARFEEVELRVTTLRAGAMVSVPVA